MVLKKHTTLIEPSLRHALKEDSTLQYSLGLFLAMGLAYQLIASHVLLASKPPKETPIGYDGLHDWFERTCHGRKDISDAFITTTRIECRLESRGENYIGAEVHFFERGQESFFVCRATFARTGEVSAVGYSSPATTPPTQLTTQS